MVLLGRYGLIPPPLRYHTLLGSYCDYTNRSATVWRHTSQTLAPTALGPIMLPPNCGANPSRVRYLEGGYIPTLQVYDKK